MESIVKSQLAKMLLLLSFLSLLFLTPFISTSLRSSYLYFLLNLLIIVLGAEAGLLASISKPHDEKKPLLRVAYSSSSSSSTSAAAATAKEPPVVANHVNYNPYEDHMRSTQQEAVTMHAPVQKLQVEKKIVEIAERVQKLKRCISKPSIFFIGEEADQQQQQQQQQQRQRQVVVEEEKVAVEEFVGDLMSKQELFMKAEMFIGNFYKQLKMQRDQEPRKNIHAWALS